jgi:uncharacterized protein
MIVLIILGVIIGVLSSGSGLGGGFLVVPYLLHLGKEVRVAVGTSFLFILMVAISSLFGHAKVGNVDWKVGGFLAIRGNTGGASGTVDSRKYF